MYQELDAKCEIRVRRIAEIVFILPVFTVKPEKIAS